MTETFTCGHPRSEENSILRRSRGKFICRTCSNNHKREWRKRNAEYAYEASRMRRLPDMLELARRKVAALENEARRYRMLHLLEPAE